MENNHEVKLSIVVPVHNEYTYTRWCLLSVVNRTTVPYELIIVNDHSDSKTTNFLHTFAQSYRCEYYDIEQRGWHSATCNLGMRVSRGEYICLLNSDAIVTTNWDTILIDFLESEAGKKISVVGPSTSYSASHQQLSQYHSIRYQIKYHEAEKVAQEVAGHYAGQHMITRVTGFCLFFHRNMLDIIGYLDEANFPSAGNESDWILRGLLKEVQPCWVKSSYVHHFGEASYVPAIGREEKRERWEAADRKLIKKHGQHLYDVIQKKYWKDQTPR